MNAGATVDAGSASYLGSGNTINNRGTIMLGAGELSSSIALKDGGTLSLSEGSTTLNSARSISATGEGNRITGTGTLSGGDIELNESSKLHIEGITLTDININAGQSSDFALQRVTLTQSVTSNAALSLTDSTLMLESSDQPTLVSTRMLNAEDYSYYTLTSSVDISSIAGSLTLNIDLTDESLLGQEGQLFGILLTDEGGMLPRNVLDNMDSLTILINGADYSGYRQSITEHHRAGRGHLHTHTRAQHGYSQPTSPRRTVSTPQETS